MFFSGLPPIQSGDLDSDGELHMVFMATARMQFLHLHGLLASERIHHGQGMLLGALRSRPNMSQKELADFLKRRPPTIAVMLSRMEKSGLIKRELDDTDQRKARVSLTQKGLELTYNVERQIAAATKQCFIDFSQEEKDDLKRLLCKMSDNLGDRKGPPLC